MAQPSPSPSGISNHRRRRLSEVLVEQQEPFSLDLYLLERGCSPAFLDATACGGGGGSCSTTCWPKTAGTGWTLRRPAVNKKGPRRSGVLRMLLSKILSGTTAAPPASTKRKNRQQRAAIGWRRGVAEKQSTPDTDRFEFALLFASPRAVEARMENDDGEQEQEQDEDDEEDESSSSKKQLSPVSVLEQGLFEHSSPPPPHAPSTQAMAIFGELLESAYTPPNTLLDDVLAIVAKHRSTQSKDGRRRRSSSSTESSSSTPTTPRARRRKKKKQHAQWKEKEDVDDVALEKDLARLTSLVAPDMAGAARVRAEDLLPAVEDVGGAIAAAVLDALTEETAAELIMMGMGMDHGCPRAGDWHDTVVRNCGRC